MSFSFSEAIPKKKIRYSKMAHDSDIHSFNILFSFIQLMLIKFLFHQFLLGIDSSKLKDTLFFLEAVYLLIGYSDKKTIVFGKFNDREPGVILQGISLGRIIMCKHGSRN